MRVYRLKDNKYEALSFASNNIKQTGSYTISPTSNLFVDYYNDDTGCEFLFSAANFSKGYVNITRYDLVNGIFSGEFECSLYSQTSCDTIRLTNGRFDKKM